MELERQHAARCRGVGREWSHRHLTRMARPAAGGLTDWYGVQIQNGRSDCVPPPLL